MKHLDTLNAAKKTLALCKVLFTKQLEKCQRDRKHLKKEKNTFFSKFFKSGTLERAEVLCVAFSTSGHFF